MTSIERNNHAEAKKTVQHNKQNEETSVNTIMKEFRAEVITDSNPITYCGADHLKVRKTLRGLIKYDDR